MINAGMLWVLTAVSLLGVVLNIKKKRSCFVLWIITNGLWAAVDFYSGLQAQGALFTIYLILAIYGWFAWEKNDEENCRQN